MANQLYTKSYFIKRLIESGFFVNTLVAKYSPKDKRYWTLLVNPYSSAILITCIREKDSFYFKIIGPNHSQTHIDTKSMLVIVETLKNINNHLETVNIYNEKQTDNTRKETNKV